MEQNDTAIRTLNYEQLLQTLQGLCKNAQTGIMVICSEHGETAQLILNEGIIFDVSYDGIRGDLALQGIKKIRHAKASFFKRAVGSASKHIDLSTPNILQILSSKAVYITPPLKAIEKDKTPVCGEQMLLVEMHLAILIGPVAHIIYENYKQDIEQAQSLMVLNKVIDRLAKQVLSNEQQILFKQSINSSIDSCLLKKQDSSIATVLKSVNKSLYINSQVLSLYIHKYATHGIFNSNFLNVITEQLEYAGELAGLASLFDILKFLEQTTKTGVLSIEANGKQAKFYFQQGQLINVELAGYARGLAVALEVLQWQPDKMRFNSLTQLTVTSDIRQNVSVLIESLYDKGFISKQDGLKFIKPVLSINNLQLNLEKEIGKLQAKVSDKPHTESENNECLNQAIQLAQSYYHFNAQQLLCELLLNNDNNYKAWFWLARVLTNMTAIEFALKKAAYLNNKSSELAIEIRNFSQAKKIIQGNFVSRCPFCWTPVAEKSHECHYCQADFYITPHFFNRVGKAKIEILDKSITRYDAALQKNSNYFNDAYLHFYLAMAYLNRQYYQEALAQLEETVKLMPANQALNQQVILLKNYMFSAGLIAVKNTIELENSAYKIESYRILVVEDSMVTRKVIARTLSGAGYEVFEAKNAEEALENIEKRGLNLILLDIILPGRDGYQILAEIRQKPLLAKLPVIMLTSRDSLFDKLKGKVSDANEYLTKPFQPDELLSVVKKYLK